MDSIRTKLLITLWAYGLIVGAVIGLVLVYIFPQFYFSWYPGCLAFYMILETLIVLYVVSSIGKARARQTLNIYMSTKLVKFFGALAFVGIYAAVDGTMMKSFVLVFMLLYLLFLFIETRLFTRLEKHLKEKTEIE